MKDDLIHEVIISLLAAAILAVGAWALGLGWFSIPLFTFLGIVFWAYHSGYKTIFLLTLYSRIRSLRAFVRKRALVKAFLNWRTGRNDVPSLCIRENCNLGAYKLLLQELTDKSTESLLWTNIYLPTEVMEGECCHRDSFREKNIEKKQISFVRKSERDKALCDPKLADFEASVPNDGGGNSRCYYAYEDVRSDDDGIVIGDYAIFDRCLMVNFNPTTQDKKTGDLFITFGDVGAHLHVFDVADKMTAHFKHTLNEL